MRKLVHIERIKEIAPIAGADNIVVAKILDWECIIKKDELKVGDLAVYFEIDSQLQEREEFEFLRQRKFRVRTIKLRGQLSQGLALPLSILPEGKYKEGQDVTDLLGVTHYDPEHLSNVNKELNKKRGPLMKFLFKFALFRKLYFFFNKKSTKGWPEFVPHTDEENIQAIFKSIKNKYGDKKFFETEKVDFQSATYFTKTRGRFFKKKDFGVCSRTIYKKTPDDSLWWTQANKYDLKKKLCSENFDVIVQGESGDTNVQKNIYKISEPRFWVFNVIDSTRNYHYNLEEMEAFCKKHELEMVPVLNREFTLPETVEELLEHSKGKSVINKNTIREGVVIRLIEDGKKLVSFKVKNPDFLIKHEE
jgi:hypothetical protein